MTLWSLTSTLIMQRHGQQGKLHAVGGWIESNIISMREHEILLQTEGGTSVTVHWGCGLLLFQAG